jgi:hypothetical protein
MDELQSRISQVESRVAKLSKVREQIVGKLAVETQNKKRALKELSELGYDVESHTVQELKDLQTELGTKSEAILEELETNLDKAEALVSKFKEL